MVVLTHPIEYLGKKFKTAEHLYNFLKYDQSIQPLSLQTDRRYTDEYCEIIRNADSSYEAKILGSMKVKMQAPRWVMNMNNTIEKYIDCGVKKVYSSGTHEQKRQWKIETMNFVLGLKFRTDKTCSEYLTNITCNDFIVFESPSNRLWGSYYGKGDNMMGKLLMKIREEIRPGISSLLRSTSIEYPNVPEQTENKQESSPVGTMDTMEVISSNPIAYHLLSITNGSTPEEPVVQSSKKRKVPSKTEVDQSMAKRPKWK